jgi:squalene cyclase
MPPHSRFFIDLQGLVAAGEDPKTSKAIGKAVDFLLKQQRPNGGWGESYLSCVDKAYPEDGTGGESFSRDTNTGLERLLWHNSRFRGEGAVENLMTKSNAESRIQAECNSHGAVSRMSCVWVCRVREGRCRRGADGVGTAGPHGGTLPGPR